jgi:hypothetical protein
MNADLGPLDSGSVSVGTVFVDDDLLLPEGVKFQSHRYSRNWRLADIDGGALDKLIRAAGWSFMFLGQREDAIALGSGGGALCRVLNRILIRIERLGFNSLELTAIRNRRFLGIPYTAITAHPRHIQESGILQTMTTRQKAQHDARWARGANPVDTSARLSENL